MKTLYILGLLVLIGIATFGIISFSNRTVIAQEALDARIPPELRNYRIAYLVDSNAVEATSLRAPVNLQQTVSAQVATSWDQVMQASDLSAIIIDRTATHMIDRAWLANAYRNGLVVSMFNVYAPEMGELVGNACLSQDGFATDAYPGDFFVTSAFLILGDNPSDVSAVVQQYSTTCSVGNARGITGFVTTAAPRSTEQYADTYGIEAFAATLLDQIQDIQETYQHFATAQRASVGE
ncbi:MAG: hypothetical protein SF123_20060 [Chloroflexota bacterium]|nr:hypothetical protein [Chloroflexota bacterium]